jgi:hypothetical protein
MSLEIGSLVLPDLAGIEIDQQYAPLGGETILRAGSGRAIKQMTYQRLRITTSGAGWLPAALEMLDYTAQHALRCIVPRGQVADFATRQATLPAARRSDAGYLPFGTALLASGQAIDTAVGMAGNVATCAAVSGAVSYHVSYFPAPTVYLLRPQTSGSLADASYRWELVAEEI